jgi:hypothetical protein
MPVAIGNDDVVDGFQTLNGKERGITIEDSDESTEDYISLAHLWIPQTDTWTYASATSFTVSGDLTTVFQKGTRLRYKQSGAWKYATVASSSHSAGTTTVTVIENDDYSVANAAITDGWYSYAVCPQGWPVWFNYSPTYNSGSTMSFTVTNELYAKFCPLGGNALQVDVSCVGTTAGTATNSLYASHPVNVNPATYPPCPANTSDGGATLIGYGFISSVSGDLYVRKYDASNFGLGITRFILIQAVFEF